MQSLDGLSDFIHGPPVRHIPAGDGFSLVSLVPAALPGLNVFVTPCGGQDRSPSKILSACLLGPVDQAVARLACTTALHLLLSVREALPCTALLRALELLKESGLGSPDLRIDAGVAVLDCRQSLLRLAHTTSCTITALRSGVQVPLQSLNARHCAGNADQTLLSGWFRFEAGDRIHWRFPDASKTGVVTLEQSIEKATPDVSKEIKPGSDTDISAWISSLADELSASLDAAGFEAAESRVRLIIEEAVLNAWKHGNRKNPSKTIRVSWRIGVDCVLSVEDEGPGFDHQKIGDPRSTDNLLKLCGRGIFIIKNYAGDISWSDDGRVAMISIERAMPGQQTGKDSLQCSSNLIECWKALS